MPQATFDLQPLLSEIAMAVRVEGMIADEVCPVVDVPPRFAYTRVDTGSRLRIPDVRIGRTSRANQVEHKTEDTIVEVEDYGLEDPVPVRDTHAHMDQMSNVDPEELATEATTQLVILAREKRVADLVFTLNHYNPDLRKIVEGNGRWSVYGSSNPRTEILAMKDRMLVKPNLLVLGQQTWTYLSQHPQMVESAVASGAGLNAQGAISLQQAAHVLQIDRILVGEAWNDTARQGQAASHARMWGPHAAMLRIERPAASNRIVVPTWCFTGAWMRRRVGRYFEPGRGILGTNVIKVFESCRELISWQDAGYFWEDAGDDS